MKTVVILALIFAVCMCSGGDVSGTVKPGEDEKDKPFPSAGSETAVRGEVLDERVERVSQFMVTAVKELKKDPITTSDVLVNLESSSHKSGDNQKGVDGVQNEGATAEFSRNGKVAIQEESMLQENTSCSVEVTAAQKGMQRRIMNLSLKCVCCMIPLLCGTGVGFFIVRFAGS
jgi:hypothetical protein